ncbi:hypothetical protein ACIQGO_26650 [Streptomyces shenzhenensis]|uniref:hypothetical protein n=1 Tax=Streptomyces shenzhenensis TaxID=943815 RepID=UPI00381D43FC
MNYYDFITVGYELELAQLDDQGHRLLRTAAADDPAAGLEQQGCSLAPFQARLKHGRHDCVAVCGLE